MEKYKFLISKKLHSDRVSIFSCNICILIRLLVKVLVSKGWVHSNITVQTL